MPQLAINEVWAVSGKDANTLAVEILNRGTCPVQLSQFRLMGPSGTVRLPEGSLTTEGLAVVELTAAGGQDGGCPQCLELALVYAPDLQVIDRVTVPSFSRHMEAYGRFPDGRGDFTIYGLEYVSPGAPNKNSGPVFKVAGTTGFRPRDSSSNASLRYGTHYWILGGWSNFGHDLWYSRPDVWRSQDGIRWELLNDAPPYNQYSSFLDFKGRMWALGPESFSSADGVTWIRESIPWSRNKRAVVFRGAIYGFIDSRVVRSTDGKTWMTLLDGVPWGPDRKEPIVLVFDDRLWFIGGTTEQDGKLIAYHNDVWTSDDGIAWSLVTPEAGWSKRRWANGVVHEGRMYVINGANHELWPEEFGNVADLWYSDNGKEWHPVDFLRIPWAPRHASFVMPTPDGAFLLSSGYGHGGERRIYNDIWKVRLVMYFPKPEGDLSRLETWGSTIDGAGAPPSAFDDPNSYFIFRGRARFEITGEFKASNIVIGDGQSEVLLTDPEVLGANARIFLRSGATLHSCISRAAIRFQAAGARAVCRQ